MTTHEEMRNEVEDITNRVLGHATVRAYWSDGTTSEKLVEKFQDVAKEISSIEVDAVLAVKLNEIYGDLGMKTLVKFEVVL